MKICKYICFIAAFSITCIGCIIPFSTTASGTGAFVFSPVDAADYLEVVFDEKMLESSISPSDFVIQDGPSVIDAHLKDDGKTCTLSLEHELLSGGEYNLVIGDVLSESGNELSVSDKYLFFKTLSVPGKGFAITEDNSSVEKLCQANDLSLYTLNGNSYFAPQFDKSSSAVYYSEGGITGFSFYTCIHGMRDTSTFFNFYVSENGTDYQLLTEGEDYTSERTVDYPDPSWTWSTCRINTAPEGTLPPGVKYLKIEFPRIYSNSNHSKSAALLGDGTVWCIGASDVSVHDSAKVFADDSLEIYFGKEVSAVSADMFSLSGGLVIDNAVLSSDGKSATLKLSTSMEVDTEYQLCINSSFSFADGKSSETNKIFLRTASNITPVDYEWSNVKIGGGGMIVGFTIHPQDSDIVYARTDVGGAYRWEADKKEWIPLNDSFGLENRTDYTIAGIAVDPKNKDIVYIACGGSWQKNGCLLKSTDRGESWIKSDLAVPFHFGYAPSRYGGECVAVDPSDSDIVWCGTPYNGLWKSTDGGLHWRRDEEIPCGFTPSWTNVDMSNRDAGIRSIVFDSQGSMYVGVNPSPNTDGGVYRLKNEEWEYLEGSPKNVMILRTLGTTVYASDLPTGKITSTAVLYTFDGGVWTQIEAPEEMIDYTIDAAYDEMGRKILFACGRSENRLYYSADGGEWIAAVGADDTVRLKSNDYWCTGIKYDFKSIKSYIADGELSAWIGNGVALYHTPDVLSDSSEYTLEICGIDELFSYPVAAPSNGEARLFTGNLDFSGFRITDTSDYSAVKKISNMYDDVLSRNFAYAQEISAFDYCAENSDFVAAFFKNTGGSVIGVATSDDNGQRFEYYQNNLKELFGIAHGNVAVSGRIGESGYPSIVAVGIVTDGSGKSGVLYSDDFGRTWNKSAGIDGSVLTASGQYQRRVLAADRQTADVFYINDVTNGIFYVSTDGGKTFAPSGLAYEAQEYSSFLRSSIEANPQKAGEVWFSTFESGLFKADNFGKTAKRVPYVNSVEAFSFGAPVSDSDEASMFVLAEIYGVRGLYRSDDGGKSWIKLNSSDFGLGNALEICGDKRTFGTVYVSTAGRSVLTARIPGDYTELWAKVTDTEKNAVFVEFTQALDSDTVSKTAFSVYDSAGNAVLTDDITLSRDLKTVKLTLTENLIEDNIYTVCISESIKSLSQAGVYPDYRTLKFYASELSEGVKNFHDNVADISLMYSCTEENLKKWIYYDNDDTAMTAKRQSAEVVYRVNGSITEFDVRTIHYSTSHDSQWRFYVSSDGENWTELQKNTHYTSKYVSPPEGAVYSYASYYMHTSVQGTLEAMRARYVKICYPSLYDSSSDGGESRGLLDVSIDYTYGTLVSISSENSTVEDPAFIELSFDRQMPELTEQTFTITDIDKNEYIISAVNMSETLKSCILVMQAPLADGAYTLTVDEGIKSLDGVGINSAFTSINFNVRTLTDDKIFLSDSTIVINSDVVRYSVRITSAYDGVMVKPVLAVYESGSLAAIEQIETLKLDAGGFSDVCLETAVRNLKDISVSVFLWNDYKTITPLRRKIVIKR